MFGGIIGSWIVNIFLRFFYKTLNMSRRFKLPELLKANLQQDKLILL